MSESIESRLRRLERLAAIESDDGIAGVPAAWFDRGEHGRIVGPPPDVVVTPAERRMLETITAMDATIPFC